MKNFASLPSPRLIGVVALCALMTACAVPYTRTSRVYGAPGQDPYAARGPDGYDAAPGQAAPDYARYGTVARIDVIDTTAHPTGGGALAGAVIGGVLGNQFGAGGGRAAMTALGVFGGAIAGDQIERNQDAALSNRVYRVIVRFDDGSRRRFDYRDLNGLRTGDRVRFERGVLDRA